MKKNILLAITCVLVSSLGSAQVLFEEDFNSYPAGHLNTDYTGTTAGQGGWLTERHANASATAMVAPETGKGNVLIMTTNSTVYEYISILQGDGIIDTLWNNRTAGNNVLKFEYEIYGSGTFYVGGSIERQGGGSLMNIAFVTTSFHSILAYYFQSQNNQFTLKQYDATTFPYNMWIKAELFIDYNAQKAYFYIPTLNLFKTIDLTLVHIPSNIILYNNSFRLGSIVKFDNIKLTALQSVPAYIDALSANEWVSSAFNLYPNPAANVVNITNSENMLVQQVAVYDITGKQLSIQTFNNQVEIQLNVENLASGVYMLHIETNAGTAVKKLIKK